MMEKPTLPAAMELLPSETMGVMRRLEFESRKRMRGFLSGRHPSPDKGQSVEFAEHREYAPGDDLRNLDWRLVAKNDRHYIKQYVNETSLRATIVVDVSGSMAYRGEAASTWGGKQLSKFAYARYLAAAMAYAYVRQGDGAGLVTFDTKVKKHLRVASRPGQVRRILEELHGTVPGDDTAVAECLHDVAERIPRRGLVVLISDLFDEPTKIVEALHHFDFRQHELAVLHVLAEEEVGFPFTSYSTFEDLEGVAPRLRIDPQSVRALYLERMRAFLSTIEKTCGRMGADYVPVNTKTPVGDTLVNWLVSRKARRR